MHPYTLPIDYTGIDNWFSWYLWRFWMYWYPVICLHPPEWLGRRSVSHFWQCLWGITCCCRAKLWQFCCAVVMQLFNVSDQLILLRSSQRSRGFTTSPAPSGDLFHDTFPTSNGYLTSYYNELNFLWYTLGTWLICNIRLRHEKIYQYAVLTGWPHYLISPKRVPW